MENFFSADSLGLIASGLLVVGVIKFILYYKAFNIEVLKYIETSEILILFADNISIASVIIIGLVPPYVYSVLPYLQSAANAHPLLFDVIGDFWRIVSCHVAYQIPIAATAIAFTLTRKKIISRERWTYVGLTALVVFVIPLTVIEAGRYAAPFIKPVAIVSIGLVLNFFVIILLATWNEIYKVKAGYFKDVEVSFESDIIAGLPEGCYYVGKVKCYVFFFSPSDGQSIAYSTDKLISIKYKPHIKAEKLNKSSKQNAK